MVDHAVRSLRCADALGHLCLAAAHGARMHSQSHAPSALPSRLARPEVGQDDCAALIRPD